MALQKQITNLRTGHANAYWRLTGIAIDAHSGHVQLVLSGYADAQARAAGRQPDDRRDWQMSGPAFGALAFQPAAGATVYDVIANASYSVIRTTRRPLVPGTAQHEDGSLTLPNGEVIAAVDVDKPDPDDASTWTVPSEFADAENV